VRKFLGKKFAKNFQKRTRVDSECGYRGMPPWYGEAQAKSFYLPTLPRGCGMRLELPSPTDGTGEILQEPSAH